MSSLLIKSLDEIREFNSVGFAKTSAVLLIHIRKNKDENIRIFKPGGSTGKGNNKYSSVEIFGNKHFSYIYDIRCKKKLIDFLVNTFLTRHPDPDLGLRKAFTHIMHINKLHWDQCYCKDKEY